MLVLSTDYIGFAFTLVMCRTCLDWEYAIYLCWVLLDLEINPGTMDLLLLAC